MFIRGVKIMQPAQPDYAFDLPAVKQLISGEGLALNRPVSFLVGENGSGKSTLIEAIALAAGFNAEGGSRNFRFSTRQSHSNLYESTRLIRGTARPKDGYFLRAESFYNLASNIDSLDGESSFGPSLVNSYGGKSLHAQSHGESFMALVENRFGGHGLYILDEPEAALSPARQFQLLAELNRLIKADSQFIIATHSPILMAYPDAEIYVLGDQGVQLTPYRETDPYVLTRQFLLNPEGIMRQLLDD